MLKTKWHLGEIMKWSIPSFNIFPPRATPWAFENWFVQIPVPWTKIVSKSPTQVLNLMVNYFAKGKNSDRDFLLIYQQPIWLFKLQKFRPCRRLLLSHQLAKGNSFSLNISMSKIKLEYSSGKTWHFRFKFPILPRHGSNSPPPAHGWKSNARELSKRGEGCWAFELIDT